MRIVLRAAVVAGLCAALSACATGPKQTISLPAPPAPGEPAGLAGLSAAGLKLAYGAPSFVRKDGGAQMWRYDSTRCKAFFFLYPDEGRFHVRHVETLPRGKGRMAADPSCLDSLRAKPSLPVS